MSQPLPDGNDLTEMVALQVQGEYPPTILYKCTVGKKNSACYKCDCRVNETSNKQHKLTYISFCSFPITMLRLDISLTCNLSAASGNSFKMMTSEYSFSALWQQWYCSVVLTRLSHNTFDESKFSFQTFSCWWTDMKAFFKCCLKGSILKHKIHVGFRLIVL